MRSLVVRVATMALMIGLLAGPAFADAPVRSEPGVDGAHPHHVQTPAGCVDIDAVYFTPSDRGLHRGGDASGPNRGPWHGPCP